MKSLLTAILFFAYVVAFAQVDSAKDSLAAFRGDRIEVSAAAAREIDQLIHTYQFNKALVLLNRGQDSLSIDVLQRKGYCYFQIGNYGDAIREFEKVMKLDSMNTHALFQLAQLYGRSREYKEAYTCYRKLISRDTLNSLYYKQFAIVASQANDPIVSLSNFFQALQLNRHDIEAYVLMADMLLEADQFAVADSMLTGALKVNTSPQLTLLLAKAQLGEEKYKEAIHTTEELMVKGDTLPIYARLLGISYFQLDQYDNVIPWMNYLVSSGQKAEWVYYYLGVSYKQLNKPDSAIAYLNKAIDAGISENIHNYYIQLAGSYEDVGDFKNAIKNYKAAYESSKRDILLYHLGRNYDVYYKDKSTAITYFKRYLKSDDTIKVTRDYTMHRLRELDGYH